MVGGRGSEEAGQAAREARRKRKEYEARIEQHPAVRAARARMKAREVKEPVRRDVPRLIALAIQDKETEATVTRVRRILKYHRHAGELVRRRLKGEEIPPKEQKTLMRQGENIENDFREVVRSAAKTAHLSPATEAYATAIASRTFDMEVVENLPSYLSRSERAAIKYMGIDPKELRDNWNNLYPHHRQKTWEVIASGKVKRAFESLEEQAGSLQYTEAPNYLRERGVLTFGGDFPTPTEAVAAGAICLGVSHVLSVLSEIPFLSFLSIFGLAFAIAGWSLVGKGSYDLYVQLKEEEAARDKLLANYRDKLMEKLDMLHQTIENEVNNLKEEVSAWVNQLRDQSIYLAQGPEYNLEIRKDEFHTQIDSYRKQLEVRTNTMVNTIDTEIKKAKDFLTTTSEELQEQTGTDLGLGECDSQYTETLVNLRETVIDCVHSIRESFEGAVRELIEIIPLPIYIANLNTREIHRANCYWISKMRDVNKSQCSGFSEVAKLIRDSIYNGCFYCFSRYDADRLTREQVLVNLEEDLGQ